ncbi:YncE family protein [Clostridium cochlearium]|uniref:YncE family protein n=1 Tax=Clostridium cochlearium TaxID=1494 RepID=UPI000BBCDB8B|nr:hypothetical protein [Clostridium cochlearium]
MRVEDVLKGHGVGLSEKYIPLGGQFVRYPDFYEGGIQAESTFAFRRDVDDGLLYVLSKGSYTALHSFIFKNGHFILKESQIRYNSSLASSNLALAYAQNSLFFSTSSGEIQQVDTETLTLGTKASVTSGAAILDLCSDGDFLYVASLYSKQPVVKIDPITLTVVEESDFAIGRASYIRIDGEYLYIVEGFGGGNKVFKVNKSDLSLITSVILPGSDYPNDFVIYGDYLYTVEKKITQLSKVGLNTIQTLNLGGSNYGVIGATENTLVAGHMYSLLFIDRVNMEIVRDETETGQYNFNMLSIPPYVIAIKNNSSRIRVYLTDVFQLKNSTKEVII